MKYEVNVIGLTVLDPSRAGKIKSYARASVSIPELELGFDGVYLQWRRGEFIVRPPEVLTGSHGRNGRPKNAVNWNSHSDLARSIAEVVSEKYRAFGGPMPVAEAIDEEEDTGLHRVLGVDPAVAETCDNAGL